LRSKLIFLRQKSSVSAHGRRIRKPGPKWKRPSTRPVKEKGETWKKNEMIWRSLLIHWHNLIRYDSIINNYLSMLTKREQKAMDDIAKKMEIKAKKEAKK
jgi:hypothetical protein